MKVSAAIAALAAIAAAAPGQIDERDVSPASVTAALIQVLPSSIIAVGLTNQAAASSLIVDSFKTGTPAWFGSLPSDVQSYLETANAPAGATGGPASATGGSVTTSSVAALGTGSSGSNGTASTGKYSNSTVTSTGTVSKTSAKSSGSAQTSTGASSSSSSGAAAVPTAIIGSGIAGFVGILGMLAL